MVECQVAYTICQTAPPSLMINKKKLRNGIASILRLSGLTSPARRCSGKLSVVTFHRVLPDELRQAYPFPDLAVTPEELGMYLAYFGDHFDCGTLAAQHDRFLRGDVTDRPLLAITFDDAQFDNFAYARPMLAQHQSCATFFAPVVAVERQELLWHDRLGFAILKLRQQIQGGADRLQHILAAAGIPATIPPGSTSKLVQATKDLPLETRLKLVDALSEASGSDGYPEYARLMTFDELAGLSADGHEIGSHSMTHCMMPECDDSTLDFEIAVSRKILQERLGLPIESFCYPNGNADARTAQAAARAGYRRAVTTSWGNNGQDADQYRLRRFDMVARHIQDDKEQFLPALLEFRMSGFYPGLG